MRCFESLEEVRLAFRGSEVFTRVFNEYLGEPEDDLEHDRLDSSFIFDSQSRTCEIFGLEVFRFLRFRIE